MRAIKFRAWDPTKKKMTIDFCVWADGGVTKYDSGFDSFIAKPKYILMQFTGLKDCKGKEIYEGNLVRLFMVRKGEMSVYWESCEVFFRNGRWNAGFPEGQGKDLWAWTRDPETYAVEVIGNVHQNPNLLEVKPDA